jgi:hypothetical protein
MRIYVAGRVGRYLRVRALIDDLRDAGHEITHDWTRNEGFCEDGHPLSTNDQSIPPDRQARIASDDITGCAAAELIVVIADEPLCGALIEIGVALANDVPVWICAPWRWTVFWSHPLVRILDSEAEVRWLLRETCREEIR